MNETTNTSLLGTPIPDRFFYLQNYGYLNTEHAVSFAISLKQGE